MKEVLHNINYISCYIVLIIFTLYYWENQIWRSAKGFNGKLQLYELLKLAGVYGIIFYGIEIVFSGVIFDPYFGGFLLVVVGMAKVTDLPIFNKNKKDKEESN